MLLEPSELGNLTSLDGIVDSVFALIQIDLLCLGEVVKESRKEECSHRPVKVQQARPFSFFSTMMICAIKSKIKTSNVAAAKL